MDKKIKVEWVKRLLMRGHCLVARKDGAFDLRWPLDDSFRRKILSKDVESVKPSLRLVKRGWHGEEDAWFWDEEKAKKSNNRNALKVMATLISDAVVGYEAAGKERRAEMWMASEELFRVSQYAIHDPETFEERLQEAISEVLLTFAKIAKHKPRIADDIEKAFAD